MALVQFHAKKKLQDYRRMAQKAGRIKAGAASAFRA